MDDSPRSRFQFSIRTLLLLTVVSALLLVPVAWVARERRQMVLAQRDILLAREVALRSVVREETRRQQMLSTGWPPPTQLDARTLEDLKRENESLKQEVKQLRLELNLLRHSPESSSTSGR